MAIKPGRDGSKGFAQVLEMHAPLDLVILALGANDYQLCPQPWTSLSAMGIQKLVDIIRQSPAEPGMPTPKILVAAPPLITTAQAEVAPQFADMYMNCTKHGEELQKIADANDAAFFHMGSVVRCSDIDGIHLDAGQYPLLAKEIARIIRKILK